ncbi:GNAT family N-acetyltransferase [Cellvibrio sp. PSBB023]|uniref:GNAT family N-acetyltransferase n=1 Tax=Cellvibrio sp. PSBB023 TaxID=1945512 RepID=UPI00098EC0C9|nr:GNAT family N-acetyltransferase [Cellvibrio sp. PSBB023]AQT62091.1 GNAT family N-acetyltransferase [Cellvibrio sp. PSBB023]
MKLSAVKKDLGLRLCALESKPEFFAQVARWHHQECERQGLKSTLALRQQRLVLHVRETTIPKTLIALQNDHLAGCVSLVDYTYRSSERMPKVTSASPVWLSNLFVQDEFRQQGIGNSLIDAAKNYALDLGLEELWLSATDYTDYYQKRGWEIVRRTKLGGRQVNVMRVVL